VHGPRIDAAVVWYGCPPLQSIAQPRSGAAEAQLATQDEFFPFATIDQLQDNFAKPA